MPDYPLCKHCRTVRLMAYKRRRIGICVSCEARARSAVCPDEDCDGARLVDHDFQNTEFDGCLVYARCPVCQILYVSRDGLDWSEAAEH